MLLIMGNAAHTDLIARADRRPAPHEVGLLDDGPLADRGLLTDGGWLPGGSAPTVALVAAESGAAVRLLAPVAPHERTRHRNLPAAPGRYRPVRLS
ncbi:hypothetical protein ACQPYH_29135 [Kribbella sp. CA-245084]|uniref:hypothetical protein n=1 Tax=Kribbella sp. CA-245084 TaxID=3239940 RepID=UPI003D941A12